MVPAVLAGALFDPAMGSLPLRIASEQPTDDRARVRLAEQGRISPAMLAWRIALPSGDS